MAECVSEAASRESERERRAGEVGRREGATLRTIVKRREAWINTTRRTPTYMCDVEWLPLENYGCARGGGNTRLVVQCRLGGGRASVGGERNF